MLAWAEGTADEPTLVDARKAAGPHGPLFYTFEAKQQRLPGWPAGGGGGGGGGAYLEHLDPDAGSRGFARARSLRSLAPLPDGGRRDENQGGEELSVEGEDHGIAATILKHDLGEHVPERERAAHEDHSQVRAGTRRERHRSRVVLGVPRGPDRKTDMMAVTGR